ncbi:hypothetical protein NP493_1225g02050 [Ridgeia piscesae]|uniref:Uncharacterized protein n=1 Tax=Ridgeia piscesae TaxID=27915 RepID=A0AAD9KC06_RIDPI|nr:hypothetical protein NP493_1225g02050 [Ridgeia piscesae]
MNTAIYLSAADYGQADGMCGSADGNPGNDFVGGRMPADWIKTWRVEQKDSLYFGSCNKLVTTLVPSNHLTSVVAGHPTYCDCTSDMQTCAPGRDVGQLCFIHQHWQRNDITSMLLTQALQPLGCDGGPPAGKYPEFDLKFSPKVS